MTSLTDWLLDWWPEYNLNHQKQAADLPEYLTESLDQLEAATPKPWEDATPSVDPSES